MLTLPPWELTGLTILPVLVLLFLSLRPHNSRLTPDNVEFQCHMISENINDINNSQRHIKTIVQLLYQNCVSLIAWQHRVRDINSHPDDNVQVLYMGQDGEYYFMITLPEPINDTCLAELDITAFNVVFIFKYPIDMRNSYRRPFQ